MVHFKLFLVLLALQITQITPQGSPHRNFLQWKQQHRKTYVDQTQELYRFYIYSQNVEMIKVHNSDPSNTFTLGENQFSDFTFQEFKSMYLTLAPPAHQKLHKKVASGNLKQQDDQDQPIIDAAPKPDPNVYPSNTSCTLTYDYSKVNASLKNYFPFPVLNQGSCGSCYAFSAVGALGAAAAIKYNISFIPSPQQIVSCTNNGNFGNYGCDGGWFDGVYEYASTTNISSDANYPYTSGAKGVVPACQNSKNRGPIRIASYDAAYGNTIPKTCTAMKNQLKKSPMAVAVSVNIKFSLYKSGVLTAAACPAFGVNHGVYLVGVDSCGNWKIQNSWGSTWGESGFIRLQAGNTCNVCQNGGYYPTLA